MMCEDVCRNLPRLTVEIMGPSWVAGAVTGIKASRGRNADWIWDRFIEELFETVERLGGIRPAEPASSPADEYGFAGSAYDTLGGYVSTAGEICSQGLYFSLSPKQYENVMSLLPGFVVLRARGGLIIPRYEIGSFLNLVPVNGPLLDQLAEGGMQ
jgi:hypothetical protein